MSNQFSTFGSKVVTVDASAPPEVTRQSCGCLHCGLGYPMSESGKEHYWCDVTGTRDFSAPCTNSTKS